MENVNSNVVVKNDYSYSKNFNKENYYHLACFIPKEWKSTIKGHVNDYGYASISEFVQTAIESQIKKDSKPIFGRQKK